MLNRTEQPILQPIEKVDFVAPQKHSINAQVDLFHMKKVADETTRIDLYFDAGKCKGLNGIPAFTNGLLLSGTKDKSSLEINEAINSLGGFYESGLSIENSVVTIYCLREHAQSIFDTVLDAIKNVNFHEKEVTELLSDRKQKFSISMEKVSYGAQREFQKHLFASNEIYSSVSELEDFDNATIEQLKKFHTDFYKKGLKKVVVVGDLNDEIISSFIDTCRPIAKETVGTYDSSIVSNPGNFIIEKEGAIQTAIRVGRTLFNKNHSDYLEFLVLHTILGDYFGSRLMSNIREDKGYTYGIGTMVSELNQTGYFLTSTEVRKDVRDATLKEIQYEFERLQNELVQEDELELIKNYMLGQLLKSADGPYAMTDLFLSVQTHGKSLDFYNEAIDVIKAIDANRIQELAKTYLRWEDLTVVACG
ncbi:MAG: pitrilysin family protein [Crocinitomicaceae bacterium]|nr:pitrilysin family protein [Crocinitomicaceae bacterium]